MTTRIAIVGFGQIGASIGHALADYKEKIDRVGHSADVRLMKKMESQGAFDKTEIKLPDAVRGADLVIMDYPMDMIKDGLGIIAKEVKAETVIICFAVAFTKVYEWAREILPAGQPFILLHPVINPERLADWNDTLLNAHADLFDQREMIIVSGSDTSSRALQMATDLCSLLKAKPYFTESMEADGIFARVAQLPILSAVAVLNTLIHSPGWGDARRITSRSFFRTASISELYDEEEYFGITSLLNRENTSRVLDEMIVELQEMRRMISEDDEEGLRQTMKEARQGYELWLKQRTSGEWDKEAQPELPETRKILGRLFGGRQPKDKDA